LRKKPVLNAPPTLAEAGIDKNLAHEGRKLGALSDREFEKAVSSARDTVGSIIKTALRTDDKAERRANRESELAAKQAALPEALRRHRCGPGMALGAMVARSPHGSRPSSDLLKSHQAALSSSVVGCSEDDRRYRIIRSHRMQ
jgi:hypothetical protein